MYNLNIKFNGENFITSKKKIISKFYIINNTFEYIIIFF